MYAIGWRLCHPSSDQSEVVITYHRIAVSLVTSLIV